MKKKFLFCHNWYNTYRNSGHKMYNGIMDLIFTGSKISSNFIGVAVTYENTEYAWERYEKNNSAANISKFLDKMFSSVEHLAIPSGTKA